MNDNKRKFIISVIGIFILIFTIIGVSYAVFNYARNGAKTNQIYTGAVAFSFTEGNDGIYLTDQYPTENVYNLVKGAVTDREKDSLSIASSISSGTVYYTIFIYNPDTSSTTGSAAVGLTEVNGTTPKAGYTVDKRLPDSCISVFLEATNTPSNITFMNAYSINTTSFGSMSGGERTGAPISNSPTTNLLGPTADAANPTSKVLVGYGVVSPGSSGTLNIDLYAYISSDMCTIIENEEEHENTYDLNGHRYYTQSDFGGRYYSFKVRVEANTDPDHWTSESTKITNFSANGNPFSVG